MSSCRYKIKNDEDLERIVEVLKKHNISYFFYCGGGDSMDTANKIKIYLQAKREFPGKWMAKDKTDVTDDFIEWTMPLIGGGLPRFCEFQEIYAEKNVLLIFHMIIGNNRLLNHVIRFF